MRHRSLLFGLVLVLQAGHSGCSKQAPGGDTGAAPPDPESWVARSALYEVFVTDFSPAGNFQGVIDGLDRIEGAGANVVWLMPIHPIGVENRKGTLGSPYAVRDYLSVNQSFGTKDDFRRLVEAVHARQMKLILDWVPNHTAWDNVWVSEHPDFYARDSAGALQVPVNEKGESTGWTDVAQLDYTNPGLRRAMIETMQHWLREFGIDGFRVDVAGFVPRDFWEEAVPALRQSVERPILLLAEWGDMELNRIGFDLTYAWDSYRRLKEVWRGDSAVRFVRAEAADMAVMPAGGGRLRFTTNHDETSWDQPAITLFRGSRGARAAFVAMAFLPGRPLLYNGQEVESPQVLNLFERQVVNWALPGADSAKAFYAGVINLARTRPELLGGLYTGAATSAPQAIIAYQRGNLLVLVNARDTAVSFGMRDVSLDGRRDLLSDMVQQGNEVTLPGYGAMILAPATENRP